MAHMDKDVQQEHADATISGTPIDPSKRAASWFMRLIIESFAVVFSILLALSLDQWVEDQEHLELAEKSLASFERELDQNRARLEDIAPFHRGLRDVLAKLDSAGEIRSMAEMRAVVGFEPLRPPFLTDAAWQTAVATGAFTYMDFETVSALSLTYSLQQRFREQASSTVPELIRAGPAFDADIREVVRYTVDYLTEVTTGEEDLRTVYEQALTVVRAARNGGRPLPPDTAIN